MARTRCVIRSKKNLIPTLDAEATNSPPSNQPQPPAGEAHSPPRGGFKSHNPPTVPTSEPPSNPPEERVFPSKGNSPCATKACLFNGTVYQFYHRAMKMQTGRNFTAPTALKSLGHKLEQGRKGLLPNPNRQRI